MPFWRSRTWLLWVSLWIRNLPAFGVANGSLNFLSGDLPWGAPMRRNDLRSMSLDELWNLHEEIVAELIDKIASEKARLEERLRRIEPSGNVAGLKYERRPYPKILPKYRNPNDPAETWSGRGKQPRWLVAQLRAGKKLDDFRIDRSLKQKHQ